MMTKTKLNKREILSKLTFLIVAILFSILIFRSCGEKKANKEEILANIKYGTGEITKYQTTVYGPFLEYSYKVEGVKYSGSQKTDALPCSNLGSYKCVGISKKVIYSSKKPSISYMLASKRDYEKFNLKVPKELK
jgi:hypothetical protein